MEQERDLRWVKVTDQLHRPWFWMREERSYTRYGLPGRVESERVTLVDSGENKHVKLKQTGWNVGSEDMSVGFARGVLWSVGLEVEPQTKVPRIRFCVCISNNL